MSAAPAEATTAGVVAANGAREKEAFGMDMSFSYFYSAPLSQETDPVKPLMAEEEDRPKENPPTPP